jgi:hypothetical protein
VSARRDWLILAAAAAALACAVAVLAARPAPVAHRAAARHRAPRSAAPSAPSAASRPPIKTREERVASSEDARHASRYPAARAVAARFLRAFLAYEVGAGGRQVRAVLARTATARFARLLVTSGPRFPASGQAPTHARLTSLEVEAATRHSLVAIAELVRGGRQSALVLAIVRGRGAWRIAAIR